MTATDLDTAIEVRDLVLAPGAAAFSLTIEPGAITGLVGLEKHGQEELLQVLCGLTKPVSGDITIGGSVLPARGMRSLRDAHRHGIAYLPRDRKTEGILGNQSVLDNFAIATLPRYRRAGLVSPRKVRQAYDGFARELGIVAASVGAPIRTLSGGNQQKVLLARWLAAEPRILLLNDPSRGVDHPTKAAMHELYRSLAARGTTIVLLSSEIDELLEVADPIVAFRERTVSASFRQGSASRESIIAAMFGAQS